MTPVANRLSKAIALDKFRVYAIRLGLSRPLLEPQLDVLSERTELPAERSATPSPVKYPAMSEQGTQGLPNVPPPPLSLATQSRRQLSGTVRRIPPSCKTPLACTRR